MSYCKYITSSTLAFLFVVFLTYPVTPTVAQDAGNAAANQAVLEEIIVTAQKRAESINDVPISIVAFEADALLESHITSAQDLGIVPGVTGTIGGSIVNSLAIRGIGTNDFGVGSEQSIAMFVDGIYQGRLGHAITNYFDMERVVVLKGPQGSLFGRSSSAGVFSATTTKPDTSADSRGGYVSAGLGSRDLKDFEGAVNVPLSDGMALRVAGFISQEEGWINNEYLPLEDPRRGHESVGFRVGLGFEGDTISGNLVVGYGEKEQSGLTYAKHDVIGSKVVPETGDLYTVSQDGAQEFGGTYDNRDNMYMTLTLDRELGNSTLTSVTGYKDASFSYAEDVDGDELNLYSYLQRQENEYFSQEVRFVSNNDGPLNWIVGGSYYKETQNAVITYGANEDDWCGFFIGADCSTVFTLYYNMDFVPTAAGTIVEESFIDGEYQGTSVFADVSYALNDQWELLASVRYSRDEREMTRHMPLGDSMLSPTFFHSNVITSAPFTDENTWKEFSPRIVLKFIPNEDMLFYLSASTGYKAGGFDSFGVETDFAFVLVDPDELKNKAFDAENIDAYEIGFKGSFADDRLQANVALYSYDYTNLQLIIFEDSSNYVITNVGEVKLHGAEVSVKAALGDYIVAGVGYAYSDSDIQSIDASVCADCIGNRLTLNPETEYYVSVDWTYPVQNLGGDLYFTAEYQHEDSSFSELTNAQDQIIPARNLLNLRAGLKTEDWRLTLYVENVTDEEYAVEVANDFLFANTIARYGVGRPRTVGLEFVKSF